MTTARPAARSFAERANDRTCRDWTCRASRFLRGRLRDWLRRGLQWTDDPRVVRAWRRRWDADHFIGMHRWKDEGFRPRIIYDIGANEGAWTEMAQALFHPARIFLFEPLARFEAKAARRKPVGADWQWVGVGLGDRAEAQWLHVTQNAAASSLLAPLAGMASETAPAGQEKIEVAALDALVEARGWPAPDLVKIDVQGYENRVLAGGARTLPQAQRLVIEVSLRPLYDGQALIPEIVGQLARWGFVLDEVQETFRSWPGWLAQTDLWCRRGK